MFLVLPYRDENETIRTPLATFALIGLNFAAWILVQGAGFTYEFPKSICELGLIAGELTLTVPPGTAFEIGPHLICSLDPGRAPEHIFTSMFLHGGWQHLLGNMWFLWLTGNNVEDSMGKLRFLVFYLLCGIGAAAAQVLVDPSAVQPMVGASGAISGVMGAYLILFPRVRVYTLVWIIFFITTIVLPAGTLLAIWIGLQVLDGVSGVQNGVAVWAHIGGFLTGVLLIKMFARSDYLAQHRAHHWRPRRLGLRRDRWQ